MFSDTINQDWAIKTDKILEQSIIIHHFKQGQTKKNKWILYFNPTHDFYKTYMKDNMDIIYDRFNIKKLSDHLYWVSRYANEWDETIQLERLRGIIYEIMSISYEPGREKYFEAEEKIERLVNQ